MHMYRYQNAWMYYILLYNCVLLLSMLGLLPDNIEATLNTAEQCCSEDVYHFDDTERFFLITCLATWYVHTIVLFLARVYNVQGGY